VSSLANLKLICPKCGKEYDNYKEFFNCWTTHLNILYNSDGSAPLDPIEAIEYYFKFPNVLEEGLKSIESNITIFHGKIDLLCVDKDNNFVLVDVIGDRNWKRKVNQLRKYRKKIKWTAEHIFGLKYIPFIRLIIVKPNYYVKDITSEV
jgi:hypothetical protein